MSGSGAGATARVLTCTEQGLCSKYRDGDLVWGKVKGFPAWPGQLMPKRAAPQNILLSNKDKDGAKYLVAFLGDSSYGWVEAADLEPFEAGYEHRRQTKSKLSAMRAKEFKKAVEEGKEVWDRREGRTPSTDHGAIDFLDTKTWTFAMQCTIDLGTMVYPAVPDPSLLDACPSRQALQWLKATASNLVDGIELRRSISESAMSQVWSLSRHRFHKVARAKLFPPHPGEDGFDEALHNESASPSEAADSGGLDLPGQLRKKRKKKKKRQAPDDDGDCNDCCDRGESKDVAAPGSDELGDRKQHRKKVKRGKKDVSESEDEDEGDEEAAEKPMKKMGRPSKGEGEDVAALGGDELGDRKQHRKKGKRGKKVVSELEDEEEGDEEAAEKPMKMGRPSKVKTDTADDLRADADAERSHAYGRSISPERRQHALLGGDLAVVLREVAKLLKGAARAPLSVDLELWGIQGCMARAAYLRFREAAFACSQLNSPLLADDVPREIGMLLRSELETLGVAPTALLLQRDGSSVPSATAAAVVDSGPAMACMADHAAGVWKLAMPAGACTMNPTSAAKRQEMPAGEVESDAEAMAVDGLMLIKQGWQGKNGTGSTCGDSGASSSGRSSASTSTSSESTAPSEPSSSRDKGIDEMEISVEEAGSSLRNAVRSALPPNILPAPRHTRRALAVAAAPAVPAGAKTKAVATAKTKAVTKTATKTVTKAVTKAVTKTVTKAVAKAKAPALKLAKVPDEGIDTAVVVCGLDAGDKVPAVPAVPAVAASPVAVAAAAVAASPVAVAAAAVAALPAVAIAVAAALPAVAAAPTVAPIVAPTVAVAPAPLQATGTPSASPPPPPPASTALPVPAAAPPVAEAAVAPTPAGAAAQLHATVPTVVAAAVAGAQSAAARSAAASTPGPLPLQHQQQYGRQPNRQHQRQHQRQHLQHAPLQKIGHRESPMVSIQSQELGLGELPSASNGSQQDGLGGSPEASTKGQQAGLGGWPRAMGASNGRQQDGQVGSPKASIKGTQVGLVELPGVGNKSQPAVWAGSQQLEPAGSVGLGQRPSALIRGLLPAAPKSRKDPSALSSKAQHSKPVAGSKPEWVLGYEAMFNDDTCKRPSAFIPVLSQHQRLGPVVSSMAGPHLLQHASSPAEALLQARGPQGPTHRLKPAMSDQAPPRLGPTQIGIHPARWPLPLLSPCGQQLHVAGQPVDPWGALHPACGPQGPTQGFKPPMSDRRPQPPQQYGQQERVSGQPGASKGGSVTAPAPRPQPLSLQEQGRDLKSNRGNANGPLSRVIIAYPESTTMPSTAAVVQRLKRFGAANEDQVQIIGARSLVLLDFRTAEEASQAHLSLTKSAWGLFQEMKLSKDANIQVTLTHHLDTGLPASRSMITADPKGADGNGGHSDRQHLLSERSGYPQQQSQCCYPQQQSQSGYPQQQSQSRYPEQQFLLDPSPAGPAFSCRQLPPRLAHPATLLQSFTHPSYTSCSAASVLLPPDLVQENFCSAHCHPATLQTASEPPLYASETTVPNILISPELAAALQALQNGHQMQVQQVGSASQQFTGQLAGSVPAVAFALPLASPSGPSQEADLRSLICKMLRGTSSTL